MNSQKLVENFGMNRNTGKPLAGLDHLRQSIIDILTTRIGVRVMMRDYGSNVPNLIDSPANEYFAIDLYMAVAEAFSQFEPRIKLEKISYKVLGDGKVDLAFDALYLKSGKVLHMEGLIL